MLKRCLIFAWIVAGGFSPLFAGDDGFTISWDAPTVLGKGTYGRIHRLNDGRFMAVYRDEGGICRFSNDGCRTWGSARRILPDCPDPKRGRMTVENPEFAQLPGHHPRHPGRILYVFNLRLENRRFERCQNTVALVVSDDGGKTWSAKKVLSHFPEETSADVQRCDGRGAFVLALPDGGVRIYFAGG
ncbi:MAG: exo-alpha-sialidase, partial [Kiritimatiellae bacterium]|nr:exo-alpha-sialidase [Kiritimatiellia bacterium]